MSLDKHNKDELRKIIEQLVRATVGKKLQLDKELLEDLLFETVVVSKEQGIKVKLPVWSGEFLKKIDLSQVDFTGVSWSLLDLNEEYGVVFLKVDRDHYIKVDDTFAPILKDIQKSNDRHRELSDGFIVGYTGTNAKIDLSKSFEAMHLNRLIINSCNFAGLDFSQQDLSSIEKINIKSSSLSGTRLPIGTIPLSARLSDLSGIDLSSKKINALYYIYGGNSRSLYLCNLTNCGVKINLSLENFVIDEEKIGEYMEKIRKAMSEDWVGCYLNGNKILLDGEKQSFTFDTIFSHALVDIAEQAKNKNLGIRGRDKLRKMMVEQLENFR